MFAKIFRYTFVTRVGLDIKQIMEAAKCIMLLAYQ